MMTNTETQIETKTTETIEDTTAVTESTDGVEVAEAAAELTVATENLEATEIPAEEPFETSAEAVDMVSEGAPVVEAAEVSAEEITAVAPGEPETVVEPAVEAGETVETLVAASGDAPESQTESTEPVVEAAPLSDAAKLERLTERVNAIEQEALAAANRATFLGRVKRLIGQIPESGEVEVLRERLAKIEAAIVEQIEERRTAKEAIVTKAETLSLASEWKATGEAMRAFFEEWKGIGSAGHEVEDPLWQRFQAARDTFSKRRNEWFEGRQKEWAANREKKEAFCVRAEELSDSTEWRSTADAMRNLMAEWKTAGSAGRELDDALWSRFRAAQQVFFDRRSSTYDDNKAKKEDLCTRAEAFSDSTEWKTTADELKTLQAEWKEVGPVGSRDAEDVLWNRFRAAAQSFFDRRGSTFVERDKDENENLRRKEELCVAAEQLAVAIDSNAAIEEIRALQAEWKTVGPVKRERSDALWNRFRSACDKVFENSVSERSRRQVEWSGKMHEALTRKEEQLGRLEDAITLDKAALDSWQRAIVMKPDDAIANKILNTTARIADKRVRADELKASIDDIHAKMKS